VTAAGPYALTAYPLSHDFRAALESSDGELEYLSLPQLRRLGIRELLRILTRLRGRRCLIALEDVGSESILPLLEAFAVAALPSSIEVVHADQRRERVSRRHVVRTLLRVTRASADGVLARRRAAERLSELLSQPPAGLRLGSSGRVVSINANLWFGVKAGGSLAHTGGVANGLAGAGHHVDLIAPFDVAHLRDGVVEHRAEPPATFAVPAEANSLRFDEVLYRRVRALYPQMPPRFVYQRLSIHSHLGARLSRDLRVPLVLEYNGSEVWVARHWGQALRYEALAQQAEAALLRHAQVVVTVSEVLRDELLERGLDERRIVTYPNCVDTELFDPARFGDRERLALRARHGIAEDAVVVTFVGTFGRWHGTDVLARTIRGLVRDHARWLEERRAHFLLVGDGLRMPEVEEVLVGRSGPFHTLAGLVPQPDTPAYLAASDAVVSPHVPNEDGSPFFGSPTKLFEYMAMGLPIIASELDQIGRVLQPALRTGEASGSGGAVAILVEPGSEDELAAGIRRLVDDPGLRVELGTNARALATTRYTWDAHVAAILERVEALCG
jgi:glycosyltransferase involved in cell wall biosynthesis